MSDKTFEVEMDETENPAAVQVGVTEAQAADALASLPPETRAAIVMLVKGAMTVDKAAPADGAQVVDDENQGLLVFASNAARHVFAQRISTPTCFHQVTTVRLLDEGTSIGGKLLFVGGSLALLTLQTMTLLGVASAVSAPSCVHNSDCSYGSYCRIGGVSGRITHTAGYCSTCLRADRVTPYGHEEAGRNATEYCSGQPKDNVFCNACYDSDLPGDGWNLGLTMQDRFRHATDRMFGGDWAAFLLVALVVGLYCAGELRDVKLCQITFENRGGRDAPIWIQGAMLLLGAIRQYCFLPVLCHIVAMLVLHRGSDAISICFNGVAVLFLLDIDVALFEFWIPERTREHMEEYGAPVVSDVDAVYLAAVKRSREYPLNHRYHIAIEYPN